MPQIYYNNKRIAKNTFILYVRMLVLMVVSLYTSRIVLDALGVVDYGLYNVVGGIVVALGFLTGTLNTVSSRFITVALGNGDIKEQKKTFCNVLLISICLAICIFIIGETIGLWFLYVKMQIPQERFTAALWVYQMSIVTVMVNIVSSAYNACIIAHEKMKAFAYITLIDAFGKLMIAEILLEIENYDKLIVYGASLLLIQLVNRFIYSIYCNLNFPETKTKLKLDKPILIKMFQFISWASYGSFVSMGFTQGLNILLNIFFGPTVNAARAISVQVQNAVVLFTTNFQTAVNPQLIKNVATRDFYTVQKLLLLSSKFSFFLLCILGIPIIIITPFILELWLKDVPVNTVTFVRLMLVISIWSSIANPLRVINQAEGNIKKFQICEGTMLLLIVPISYCVMKLAPKPEYVFIIHLIIELLANYIRICIVLPKIAMKVAYYIKKIYVPLAIIFTSSLLLGFILKEFMNNNICGMILLIIAIEIYLVFMIYIVGLESTERNALIKLIKRK